jgi:hypothetical protein
VSRLPCAFCKVTHSFFVSRCILKCFNYETTVFLNEIEDCSSYRGTSLLSNSYKIVSNILLSRLISYADEIIGDHQCGYSYNRSTTDQIFYICEILEKKMGV